MMEESKPQTTQIVIGRYRIGGRAANLALMVIAGLLVWWVWPSRDPSGNSSWFSPTRVSALLWLGFSVYWSASAKNASIAKESESSKSRQLHLLLLNGSLLLLLIPLPGLTGRFEPATPMIAALGAAIQVAFLAFAIWARRHLGRNWSGEVSVKVDHQLVRSGPYRVVRHPIYTAMAGMYAGSAIAIGEWHCLVAMAIVLIAYARKIRLEETALRGVFGAQYDEYRRRSWALIPPVW
jgi:protein-S-isoprenylcysteine O-methyltransferase Ste14